MLHRIFPCRAVSMVMAILVAGLQSFASLQSFAGLQSFAAAQQMPAMPPAFLFVPFARDDLNFSQAVYAGAATLNAQGFRIEVQDHADALSTEALIEIVGRKHAEGISLFILGGAEFGKATEAAAKAFPKATFATLSGTVKADNVLNYCLDCLSPGATMSGKLAVELTTSRIVGWVGGVAAIDGAEAEAFRKAILAGNPDVRVLIAWTESWTDLDAAANLTRDQISKGADVIYATANTGAITGADRSSGVKVIGSLVDVSSLSEKVVASVVLNTDVIYRHFIGSVASGNFKAGIYKVGPDDGVWSVVWRR